MICPCCGAKHEGQSGDCEHFVCGSYSAGGTPPVRSGLCLGRELVHLRRFMTNVRAADRLTTSETAIEIRRLIVDWDRGAR